MTQLTRYILRQTVTITILVALVFTAAVWLVESLRLIDLIVNRGLSLGLFLYLAMLILPRFIDAVLPVAVFIAVLFTYNRLIADSEMVVMRSAGVSQLALGRPAMAAAALAAVVLGAMSVYFMPASIRAFKDLQFEIRNKIASVLLLEGAFNTISDNVTIYVRARDTQGDLSGIVIYDSRDKARPLTMVAEHGAFVETDQGPRLVMVKGSRQVYDRVKKRLSVLSFDQYTLDLDRYREGGGIRDRQPEELYLPELLASDPHASRLVRHARMVELNFRLITPLSALALGAIPIACLLTGEFSRRGQLRRVLIAVAWAFLFEALDVGLKNLAVRNTAAILPLYLNVAAPIGATLWLLTWRGGTGFRFARRAATA